MSRLGALPSMGSGRSGGLGSLAGLPGLKGMTAAPKPSVTIAKDDTKKDDTLASTAASTNSGSKHRIKPVQFAVKWNPPMIAMEYLDT
jgi:hypothetical protein